MIQITPHMRIFLAIQPVDFRKGIEGLKAQCRNELRKDPFTGTLFIFRNKNRTSLKMLVYDGQGFWLFMKRISQGRFKWWPDGAIEGKKIYDMHAHELQILIWNGNPDKNRISNLWKPIDKT